MFCDLPVETFLNHMMTDAEGQIEEIAQIIWWIRFYMMVPLRCVSPYARSIYDNTYQMLAGYPAKTLLLESIASCCRER
jgi:hypothetical protein